MLQRIDRYEILERIAAGGQGTVYRARDTELDRIVAVKVMNHPVTDDPQYLEALRREARLAASLDHPNITRVYDLQVEGDMAYIVMEYVPDSLNKRFPPGQPLPYQRAIEIAIQICQALTQAHTQGMIHGDIKPGNILLTSDGVAQVTDLGIARAMASSSQVQQTAITGAYHYMPPEQWSSGPIDRRADIYSLGATLFEMLTGAVPFRGESLHALNLQHQEEPVPAMPRELDVPTAVEDVVRLAMAKSPEDRFPDTEAMAAALERAFTRSADRESRPAQSTDIENSANRQ
jgi:serine/threonine protein kinase